jgi:DNA-binding CsgD family transcriptional regulator
MSLKAAHASRFPMTRLSHEDWTRMNAMTLEIHRSSTEEGFFDLVSRLVKEHSGAESEVLSAPADPESNGCQLPLGPWTLRLPQKATDRTRTFYEIFSEHLSVACQRFQSRLSATQSHLSRRQNEVLPLLLQGASNIEIAHTLGISPRTVEKHITAILRLHDCTSRSQLLAAQRSEIKPMQNACT